MGSISHSPLAGGVTPWVGSCPQCGCATDGSCCHLAGGVCHFFAIWLCSPCKQCRRCLAAGCCCGIMRDSGGLVAWRVGSEQVVSTGVMLSVAQGALGGVCGSAVVQAVAQGWVTASPPAAAHSRDGVKVLPATPGVLCCWWWDRVDERAPESSGFPAEYFTRALRAAAGAPALGGSHADALCRPPQDMLMQLAKAVASAAAALVLKAKNVAQKTEDAALQTQVIAAATQCALSTSQLVACTKVSSKANPRLGVAASVTWLVAAPWRGRRCARTTRPQAERYGSGTRSMSCLRLGSLPLCPSTESPFWRSARWG